MRVKMRVKNIPAGLELHRARRSIGKPCSAPICKLVRRFVAGQSSVFHCVNVRNAAEYFIRWKMNISAKFLRKSSYASL